MTDFNTPGGKARAATATRGNGGQFLPTKPSANPAPAPAPAGAPVRRSSYKPKTVGLSLKSLDIGGEWWEALAAQYPNVNLHAELLKAMDWHGADKVKSPKLYFRNWVERASLSAPARVVELTPDQIRERLRVVS